MKHNDKKRVGLYGGTFDPPHIGHLLIAEEVRNHLDLDEIWFLPTQTPPHKSGEITQVKHRIEMTKRAIANNPFLKLNLIELERTGKSYTVDTIKLLKEMYPDHQFFFIIGADMVEYLPKWHKINELIELIQFVGVRRTGYSVDSKYPVSIINIPIFDVSSTRIRKQLNDKVIPYYYLTEPVRQYIKEHSLYGN